MRKKLQTNNRKVIDVGQEKEDVGQEKEKTATNGKICTKREDEKLQSPSKFRSKTQKKLRINSENFVMRKAGSFDVDYSIVGKIGEGSFGTVYKILHKNLGIYRALKTIKKRGKQHFSSFQEIEILKKLDHANILKIYEFYEAPETYYIITEIFEGKELFDQISQQDKLSEQFAARIVKEIMKAVNYTHSLGIAHRDIKAENILVKRVEGSLPKIKVIDWGLGTLLGPKGSDRVCGTPEYCAPEVLKGGKYSTSCDMWSMGVIIYVMLTGEMPFLGKNTEQTIEMVKKGTINLKSKVFKQISIQAQQLIVALLNPNPLKRLTAEKVLQNEWIVKHSKTQTTPHYLQQTLERLRYFRINNGFGLAVVSFLNNHLGSNQERERLEQIFSFLDSNGDGVLSLAELSQGYSKVYGRELGITIAEQTFEKLDSNGNGSLEFSQFVTYGVRHHLEKEEARLKQAFNLFDKNKDGKISWTQISVVLQGKLSLSKEQLIKEMMRQIDQNQDSQIDFQQFIKCVQKIFVKAVGQQNKEKWKEQIAQKAQQVQQPLGPTQIKKYLTNSAPPAQTKQKEANRTSIKKRQNT